MSAYLKTFLLRINEGLRYTTDLRRFLLEHPLLVIEFGFHLVLDPTQLYGFNVQKTIPCHCCMSVGKTLTLPIVAGSTSGQPHPRSLANRRTYAIACTHLSPCACSQLPSTQHTRPPGQQSRPKWLRRCCGGRSNRAARHRNAWYGSCRV